MKYCSTLIAVTDMERSKQFTVICWAWRSCWTSAPT